MGTGGKLKLEEGTAGGTHVGFKAPDVDVPLEILWELPSTDGNSGQFWTTDGSGNLAWTDNLDSTLQASIEAETTLRVNADITLQANIDAEATLRVNAIDAEATLRVNADSTLQTNVNAEATLRMNADSTLQANLNSEITARNNAETIIFTTTSIGVSSGQTIGCNTFGGPLTLTAPLSPTQGQRFRVIDVKGLAATNNIVINRNGSNIAEIASDFIIDTNWLDVTFVYYDGTVGWAPIR
jgi:hypothetical protein